MSLKKTKKKDELSHISEFHPGNGAAKVRLTKVRTVPDTKSDK